MRRALTGAVVGGVVGAAVTVAQSRGSIGARRLALRALEASLTGGLVALFVPRRGETAENTAFSAAPPRIAEIARVAERGPRQLVITTR